MANEMTILKAEERKEQGSSAAGRLRRAGFLPAAVTRIKGGTTLLKLSAHEFGALLRSRGQQQQLLTLDVAGISVPAMLREIQYHPLSGVPINADFGEIDLTRKIRIKIPLFISGEPTGVKLENGVLQHLLHSLEVECLPTDVVESFTADVSSIKLNQSMFVKDLKLGDKYTILTGKDTVIALVAEPEAEEVVATEETAATAEGATPAEPEVIAKGKKEEEGAEGEGAAAEKGAEGKGAEKGAAAKPEKGGKAKK